MPASFTDMVSFLFNSKYSEMSLPHWYSSDQAKPVAKQEEEKQNPDPR